MSEKKKLLKITKANKTVHFAPMSAKRKLTEQNSLKTGIEQMKIEEVELTDEELATHPSTDESFIPSEGNNNISLLKKLNASKELENEELRSKIAELEASSGKVVLPPNVTAAEVIKLIEKADSTNEIDELTADDTRVSVLKAAQKRKEELNNSL